MREIDDKASHELALRFGAGRLCLWLLCRNVACRRARVCRGDPRICMGLLHGWLEAIDTEKRARGSFAPLESEIKTIAEVRAYLAWHQALPAATSGRLDPASMDAREADRLRYDLIRRLDSLAKEHGRKARGKKLESPPPVMPGLDPGNSDSAHSRVSGNPDPNSSPLDPRLRGDERTHQ